MDGELIIERIMNDLNVKREIANVYYSDLEKLPIDLKKVNRLLKNRNNS